nr:hypothetical protein [uncultured Prevotella sp.]
MSVKKLASVTGGVPVVEKGEKGATVRPHETAVAGSFTYLQGGDGEAYIDVLCFDGKWYMCTSSYTTSTPSATDGHWQIASNFDFVATKLLLAEKSYIKNLGVDNILITDQGEGKGNVLLKADKDGIECDGGNFKNVKITGSTRVPFTLASSSMDIDYSDNVALISDGSGFSHILGNTFNIKWTPDQSGRRVTLVNYLWDGEYADLNGTINAPDGCYFFEDGVKKKTLVISRQVIELLGYGMSSNFYGWIVLNRSDIGTYYLYGHAARIMAHAHITGKRTGSNSGTVTIAQLTFDNRKMNISYDDTGVYTLSLPTQWFRGAAGDAIVHITPRNGRMVYLEKGENSLTFHCGYTGTSGNYVSSEAEFDISILNAKDLKFLVNDSEIVS